MYWYRSTSAMSLSSCCNSRSSLVFLCAFGGVSARNGNPWNSFIISSHFRFMPCVPMRDDYYSRTPSATRSLDCEDSKVHAYTYIQQYLPFLLVDVSTRGYPGYFVAVSFATFGYFRFYCVRDDFHVARHQSRNLAIILRKNARLSHHVDESKQSNHIGLTRDSEKGNYR